ncbi:Oidioi.mRNA.OKI2018_I69.chr1.g410.t1.cds [Oikopleura dioica]|uniref:Oidioi.mRNA.OKI2018_I69.chr1.g410.t1.cds n=1 Tax=Oikopleura dioica TaxID=34765 RepID=A0ABN7SRZ3_OIKDI|nr:Oidioi.mRNA.OKI2018_I69.chr1.g410.t1.cds [Oikopleura dioica]
MALFKTKKLEKRRTDLVFDAGEKIYAKVWANSKIDLGIRLDRCWITGDDETDLLILLDSGCPNPELNGRVQTISNDDDGSVGFSASVFTFLQSNRTYLHCDVTLCESSSSECSISCSAVARRKREVSLKKGDQQVQLKFGPLLIKERQEAYSWIVWSLLLCAAICVLLLMILVAHCHLSNSQYFVKKCSSPLTTLTSWRDAREHRETQFSTIYGPDGIVNPAATT